MRRAGIIKAGSTIKVIRVSRHSRLNITAKVIMMVMVLETTVPSVPVTACCAPITSLFMRDINDPVCARVKNEIGSR
ncbi:unannotated protein [freshwater metagenome]|uniref:Unannotated protein n=1 Tax=freshwater metagenome TaxID=449393 RepID=A0A6J6S453_9ZZZZ